MIPLKANSPSNGALFMARLGFKLFPVVPNGKQPLIQGWKRWAQTSSVGAVSTYVFADEECNWGVLPALSGHMVLDVDCGRKLKNGAVVQMTGDESLAALEAEHGPLPQTFKVSTPSGGYHLYFKGTCRPTIGKLGPGLDTRSINSYVVAPGSVVPACNAKGKMVEGSYAIVDETAPADAPDWLLDLLKVPDVDLTETRQTKEPVAELDTPQNEKDAIEYLESAPVCVEGSGEHGGEYLYQVFCQLRDLGISQDKAEELFLHHYNQRCDPPWDVENPEHYSHYTRIARNAYTYAQNAPGSKTQEARMKAAKAEFGSVSAPATLDEAPIKPIPVEWANTIDPSKTPKRNWIMSHRYVGGEITAIVGPGGVGKSLLVMTDAAAIATGKALTGFPVTAPCKVLVYNLEDSKDELRKRFEAICTGHGLSLDALNNLAFMSGRDHPLILVNGSAHAAKINDATVDEIILTIRYNKIGMLFIDPFSRGYSANENDNSQMNMVMDALARIINATGCGIGIVHHSSKAGSGKESEPDDQDNSRGASAIINAVRISQNVFAMTKSEAKTFGLSPGERDKYFKLVDAKSNLYIKKADYTWYRKESVILKNGETVGVIRNVDLLGAAEFLRAEEKERQKEEALAFVCKHVNEGSSMPVKELLELARIAKIKAFEGTYSKGTRFKTKLEEILPKLDFTLIRKGRQWMLSRRYDL